MTKRYPARQIQDALKRQEENQRLALARLLDWPEGMPPLRGAGANIGSLVALEKRGLAERLERDSLGDLRFRITEAGRKELESR